MNVGKNTSLRDYDCSEKAVELFVVANSELDVTRNDARLFVVTVFRVRDMIEKCGSVSGSGIIVRKEKDAFSQRLRKFVNHIPSSVSSEFEYFSD